MVILVLVAIGIALLVLLTVGMTQRSSGNELDPGKLAALLSQDSAARAQQLGERIFAREDLEFVLREAPALRLQLVHERSRMALLWIAERRRAARAIMRVHRALARSNAAVNPIVELRLAINYFAFTGWCRVAEILIRARGPFAAQKVIFPLITTGERFGTLSEMLANGLDPSVVERLRKRPVEQTDAS